MDIGFLHVGLGLLVCERIGAAVAAWFRANKERVEAAADKAIDAADSMIPAKAREVIGTELVVLAHQRIHDAVFAGVEYAEAFVGSADFWSRLAYILKGNPSLITNRLWTLLLEWANKPDLLPEPLKPVINMVKKDGGVWVAASHVATLPAPLQPSREELGRMIDAAAPAAGRTINPPSVLRRPEEMQAAIEALREKLK